MEAIALVFSKFSEELIAAQLALLLVCTGTALYLLLVRKKKKESAEWVPAAIVRAYLDRVQAEEREVRMKLFGELSATYGIPNPTTAPLAAALGTTVSDPSLLRELEALRAQLALSDQRVIEFDRNMNALKAEKAALEQRLKELAAGAGSAGAAGAGPGSPEFVALQKEAQDLKEKLQEYSVIEDDLANLKKFQKENEQLRQRIGQLEGGATSTAVVSGSPAPAESKTVISGTTEVKNSASMVLVSGGSPAPAASAPVAAAPAPDSSVPSAAPELNTNVLQPVTPVADVGAAATAPAAPAADANAAPAATAEKSSKQKEEELLSEFEKMLAS